MEQIRYDRTTPERVWCCNNCCLGPDPTTNCGHIFTAGALSHEKSHAVNLIGTLEIRRHEIARSTPDPLPRVGVGVGSGTGTIDIRDYVNGTAHVSNMNNGRAFRVIVRPIALWSSSIEGVASKRRQIESSWIQELYQQAL